MWARDSPPPTGGMPWRSTQMSKASSLAPSSSKLWSVPRLSVHITMGATGSPVASTGTIDEYWLQHPMAPTSAATPGARGRHLPDGVGHRRPDGLGVLLADVAVLVRSTSWRWAVAASVPVGVDQHDLDVRGADVDPQRGLPGHPCPPLTPVLPSPLSSPHPCPPPIPVLASPQSSPHPSPRLTQSSPHPGPRPTSRTPAAKTVPAGHLNPGGRTPPTAAGGPTCGGSPAAW